MKLNVNGRRVDIAAPPGTPLLWVLGDELDFTDTK
jgi:aerobic-type carbon monoxide dehydrogenase small subunit (CoxS/CutS family)